MNSNILVNKIFFQKPTHQDTLITFLFVFFVALGHPLILHDQSVSCVFGFFIFIFLAFFFKALSKMDLPAYKLGRTIGGGRESKKVEAKCEHFGNAVVFLVKKSKSFGCVYMDIEASLSLNNDIEAAFGRACFYWHKVMGQVKWCP